MHYVHANQKPPHSIAQSKLLTSAVRCPAPHHGPFPRCPLLHIPLRQLTLLPRLQEAMTELASRGQPGFQQVTVRSVFHKAGDAGDLYGCVEVERWRDGLAAGVLRDAAAAADGSQTWLVLDGPADPGLLEGLNMVCVSLRCPGMILLGTAVWGGHVRRGVLPSELPGHGAVTGFWGLQRTPSMHQRVPPCQGMPLSWAAVWHGDGQHAVHEAD